LLLAEIVSNYYVNVCKCMLIDVDECESAAGQCSDAGQCVNTDGAFRCVCSAGFHVTADGRDCQGWSSQFYQLGITRVAQVIPGIRKVKWTMPQYGALVGCSSPFLWP